MDANANKGGKGPPPPKRGALGVRGQFEWSGEFFAQHSIRDPLLILLASGLTLLCLFTWLLPILLAATHGDPVLLEKYYGAALWLSMLLLFFMLVTAIILLINLVRIGVRRVRYRPKVCPQCATREARPAPPFGHQVIEGTGWEMVTCPQCGWAWEERL